IKTINQYKLIQNIIQIQFQYNPYKYIKNILNQFFLIKKPNHNFKYKIQKNLIKNNTLNHKTIIKNTINQHLSNLKKNQKK
ncbi:DUF825 domain-containing protein, partial [Pseudomonas syringae pv. maculicola]|nr:DUF825 domain-containing protein [Pseudomonas syringae pv. maculicola]